MKISFPSWIIQSTTDEYDRTSNFCFHSSLRKMYQYYQRSLVVNSARNLRHFITRWKIQVQRKSSSSGYLHDIPFSPNTRFNLQNRTGTRSPNSLERGAATRALEFTPNSTLSLHSAQWVMNPELLRRGSYIRRSRAGGNGGVQVLAVEYPRVVERWTMFGGWNVAQGNVYAQKR